MVGFLKFKRKQPWRDALIASTGLSAFAFASSLLWNSGHHEWAFVLLFAAIWIVISISWSNTDFTEKSGILLASIMDRNFHHLHERIAKLEQELEALKNHASPSPATP